MFLHIYLVVVVNNLIVPFIESPSFKKKKRERVKKK